MSSSANDRTNTLGLTEKEVQIVKLRFGLDGPVLDPEQIASQLEISLSDVIKVIGNFRTKIQRSVHERFLAREEAEESERSEIQRLMEEPPV